MFLKDYNHSLLLQCGFMFKVFAIVPTTLNGLLSLLNLALFQTPKNLNSAPKSPNTLFQPKYNPKISYLTSKNQNIQFKSLE